MLLQTRLFAEGVDAPWAGVVEGRCTANTQPIAKDKRSTTLEILDMDLCAME
jgi:hypothetical protein